MMAELNLKQITDKLNSEFTGEVRKLIFWYDTNGEFSEDVDTIALENAKVLHLEPDNQFYIKYFLECEDRTTNYLVYAPFAKPDIRKNHLADTIRYSKEFFADRASLICLDLGIDERYKPVIQQYIKFFGSKDRMQRFYDLETDRFDRSTIETALMSVLCKSKNASFEEVMRCIWIDHRLNDHRYLAEFEKFGLLDAFWQQADDFFGYHDPKPTLEKLIITFFVTDASKNIHADLPRTWQSFVSYKSGNIIAFMDHLRNSILYRERFDELSEIVYRAINGRNDLEKTDLSAWIGCDLFAEIDERILTWIIDRLENEDTGAKLGDSTIPQLCASRKKLHFGRKYLKDYCVLENAYEVIRHGKYQPIGEISKLIKNYTESAYRIDRRYRTFYTYYDRLEDSAPYEKIRELVENIYTNDYLNPIAIDWNQTFAASGGQTDLIKQKDFYAAIVHPAKDRVVVIISDALRYEAAYALYEKLAADEKCTASITAMQGVLPSYTPLGMAALLPHKKIEYNDKYEVLIDGKICATTEQREKLLQSYTSSSKCIRFDALKTMKQADLRGVFTGQDVVYIYHNQIDARGDQAASENEVFAACEEAINEIHALIRRLSSQANTHHFLITADHGFIYKRDKIQTNDKITVVDPKSNHAGQRYFISQQGLQADGVRTATIGQVLNNSDRRVISFPLASDIFKVSGAGQNYVHGGCSPQEMLIPLLDVKVEKRKVRTRPAEIALITKTNKITNLITTLDFMQTEPISDVVKETSYRIYFASENNEKISNENIIIADKKDPDAAKRFFKLRFSFKNRRYDHQQKYYLTVYDDQNDLEIMRREIIMDIAFADDFGFLS